MPPKAAETSTKKFILNGGDLMNFSITENKRNPFGDGIPLDTLLKNLKGEGFP